MPTPNPNLRLTDPPETACPRPRYAMVLTAGLGTRMRPLTRHTPKPLIPVLGLPLLDRLLDRLEEWGIAEAVLNLHHLGPVLRDHVHGRRRPHIVLSDESDTLLETGGGVRRALPFLGGDPFFVLNGDVLWGDGPQSALTRLWAAFDPAKFDFVLLLQPAAKATGYEGRGDFSINAAGLPVRRGEAHVAPYVYAGVLITHPAAFAGSPTGRFSLNLLFDRALERGRLGAVVHDGSWYHLGTPQAVLATERLLTRGNGYI
ncbi:MAG: nucleotidyltransferase family protein [Rhodospirillaceae bacterium]